VANDIENATSNSGLLKRSEEPTRIRKIAAQINSGILDILMMLQKRKKCARTKATIALISGLML
jgi:hypothetical protein